MSNAMSKDSPTFPLEQWFSSVLEEAAEAYVVCQTTMIEVFCCDLTDFARYL